MQTGAALGPDIGERVKKVERAAVHATGLATNDGRSIVERNLSGEQPALSIDRHGATTQIR